MRPPELGLLEGSVRRADGVVYGAVEPDGFAALGGAGRLDGSDGQTSEWHGKRLLVGARSEANLDELRRRLSWLCPTWLGLRTSVGFGDRLGSATPGHATAMRCHGANLSPIFAQQSIREMDRAQRCSPRQVVPDARFSIEDRRLVMDELNAVLRGGAAYADATPSDTVP